MGKGSAPALIILPSAGIPIRSLASIVCGKTRSKEDAPLPSARLRAVWNMHHSSGPGSAQYGICTTPRGQAPSSTKEYAPLHMHESQWPGSAQRGICTSPRGQALRSMEYTIPRGQAIRSMEDAPLPGARLCAVWNVHRSQWQGSVQCGICTTPRDQALCSMEYAPLLGSRLRAV